GASGAVRGGRARHVEVERTIFVVGRSGAAGGENPGESARTGRESAAPPHDESAAAGDVFPKDICGNGWRFGVIEDHPSRVERTRVAGAQGGGRLGDGERASCEDARASGVARRGKRRVVG